MTQAILFYLFAIVTGVSAIGVVAARDIVRAAVFLLFCLLGVAGVFLLLSAPFLAAVQLIVYAGGILVLIVFGVMLTGRSPLHRFEPSRWERAAAAGLGVVLLGGLALAYGAAAFADRPMSPPADSAAAFGGALLGPYLAPFEIASILLLVVMIGAAYLAKRRQKTEDERQ
jgi:NADH-quinone oxidoreductase subunit J